MSVFGTGRLHIVEEHMNQVQYKMIMEKRLIPQLNEWASKQGFSGTGDLIFMHDGAPCHKGRLVTEFLKAHGIETLPWPGNSPDNEPHRESMEHSEVENPRENHHEQTATD